MLKNLKTRLTNRPFQLFLLTAFILVIATFFSFGQSMDIHIHATHFILTINYFICIIAVLFVIGWVIYVLTNKFLWKKALTWLHVLATIFGLAFLVSIIIWHHKAVPSISGGSVNYQAIIDEALREKYIGYPIEAILVLGQVAYIVNLIGGLIRLKL